MLQDRRLPVISRTIIPTATETVTLIFADAVFLPCEYSIAIVELIISNYGRGDPT
jgi:hypothetical protein